MSLSRDNYTVARDNFDSITHIAYKQFSMYTRSNTQDNGKPLCLTGVSKASKRERDGDR